MHLLYFVQYFPPENAAGLPLVQDMLEGFANKGWKVDVYVPTPTRGVTKEERKRYKKKRRETLCEGNLVIHRMPLYREKKNILQRTIRYSIFTLQCIAVALFVPADAVFTGAAPPSQALLLGVVKKLTKKKVIYNPQDLFPDSLIVAGKATESSLPVKIGRKLEKSAYKNADLIITITDDMAETIKARLVDGSKVKVVRNWIDTEKIVPIEKKNNTLLSEFGINPSKFTVVYAGNIGMMQGIEIIVNAARELETDEDVQFIIFGNGSEEDRIKAIAEKIKNLYVYPLQPAERISEVYSLGDVSIVSCKPGTGRIGMPSKTWTIMATGTPIIASFDLGGEMEAIMNEADCGRLAPAGDVDSLVNIIKNLKENSALVDELGNNARRYACEKVSKEKAVHQYIKLISEQCEI